MAENGNNGAEDRKPTERVVLERVNVLLIPEGATDEQVLAAHNALNPKSKARRAVPGEAWMLGTTTIGSKKDAIESYAGKAGTSTAKIGTFRAVPLRSWKGAVVHDAPPAPLVQRSLID